MQSLLTTGHLTTQLGGPSTMGGFSGVVADLQAATEATDYGTPEPELPMDQDPTGYPDQVPPAAPTRAKRRTKAEMEADAAKAAPPTLTQELDAALKVDDEITSAFISEMGLSDYDKAQMRMDILRLVFSDPTETLDDGLDAARKMADFVFGE